MNEYEFIKYVKSKRQEKNILLKDMAKMLNVSSSYYSRVENNQLKLTYHLIKKISEILDINLNIIKDFQNYNHLVFYD